MFKGPTVQFFSYSDMWFPYAFGREFRGKKRWESKLTVYLQLGTQDDFHDNTNILWEGDVYYTYGYFFYPPRTRIQS